MAFDRDHDGYRVIPNSHLRRKAQSALTAAVKAGKLMPSQYCEDCGRADGEKLDGHHEDYSAPLDIIWLCRACHVLRHRGATGAEYGLELVVSGQVREALIAAAVERKTTIQKLLNEILDWGFAPRGITESGIREYLEKSA